MKAFDDSKQSFVRLSHLKGFGDRYLLLNLSADFNGIVAAIEDIFDGKLLIFNLLF